MVAAQAKSLHCQLQFTDRLTTIQKKEEDPAAKKGCSFTAALPVSLNDVPYRSPITARSEHPVLIIGFVDLQALKNTVGDFGLFSAVSKDFLFIRI